MASSPAITPLRPRGRPRAFDPESVLMQAAEVFWRQGFAATSLDDLVAATGVNRPSLYATFGDKEAIYQKAMAQIQHTVVQVLSTGIAVQPDDRCLDEVLRRYFSTVIDFYLGDCDQSLGCPLFCTAVAEAATSPAMQGVLVATLDGLDGFLVQALAEVQQRVGVRGWPAGQTPAALAAVIGAIQLGLAMRARAQVGRAAMVGFVDRALAALPR